MPGRQCAILGEITSVEVCRSCMIRQTSKAPEEPKADAGSRSGTIEEADLKLLLKGHESWLETREREEGEMRARKNALCKTCIYHIGSESGIICDYLSIAGKRRPCPAEECEAAGVYVCGGRKRRGSKRKKK